MEILELGLPDCFLIKPKMLPDRRGCFYESFKQEALSERVGHPVTIAQVNYSVSRRGTLRGVHGTRVPPGQAKFVSCLHGEVLDATVDLRVGSPTFGKHVSTHLVAGEGTAVYMAEGLGHVFYALTDDVVMSYLCTTPYLPEIVVDINPLDPELGLSWDMSREPMMSEKDRNAPTLAEALAAGELPHYDDCVAMYEKLRAGR